MTWLYTLAHCIDYWVHAMPQHTSVRLDDDTKTLIDRLQVKLRRGQTGVIDWALWQLGEAEGFAVDGQLLPDAIAERENRERAR